MDTVTPTKRKHKKHRKPFTVRFAKTGRYFKGRRAELKAKGLCQDCGDAPAKVSRTGKVQARCVECGKKATEITKKRRQVLRDECRKLGICTVCFKNLSLKTTSRGHDSCEKCAPFAEKGTDRYSEHREEINARRQNTYAVKHGRACWLPGWAPQGPGAKHGLGQPQGLE